MNKTTKIVLSVAAVVLIANLVGWRLSQKPVQSGAIKIGSILSLSGEFASFGEEINRGALIALDEAKQSGLMVSYDVEDDQSDAKGSVNAASKLIENGNQAVFTATVQQVKPIAPLFSSAKIPLLAVWDSNNFIRTAGPYVFTIGFSTEGTGAEAAQYAYTTLGLRKAAIVYKLDDWSKLIAASFAAEFRSLGGQVVMNEGTIEEQKDFRTFVSKAKSLNPDVAYIPLQLQDAGIFLKQSMELGLKATFITGDAFSNEDVKIAGKSTEGIYFTNIYAQDAATITAKYKAKYNQNPFDPSFVSFGYDAIKVLLEAERISTAQNIPLRDALTQVRIKGAGADINMNGGRYSDRVEAMFKVENGDFVKVQ
jgi:branched-chain amino acid transport system substrate-binding protein